ncbi:hypothetical protein MYXE_22290 [Mycobacterium xenopi]|uniref:Uncharacterized protein n=1 Tax=Mycobacterium xenopi TaxID=1789 RepID=A0AAD1H2R6_MYCXE|nr:hypothetical protein MYXE_22290 [Mycobacterium xenopi]
MRLCYHIHLGAVGGQHVLDDRFHAGVGDQGDRMAIDHAGQCEAQSQGAAGGFDDACPRQQVTAQAGPLDHVHGRAVFHATGVSTFEFGPKTAVVGAKRLRDPYHRSVADHGAHPAILFRGRAALITVGAALVRAGTKPLAGKRMAAVGEVAHAVRRRGVER